MKRMLISLAIFALVGGVSFFGIRFVNATHRELSGLLDKAEGFTDAEDFEGAKEVCKKAESLYVKREKWLSVFVNRGDLNEIGVCLSAVAPLAGKESEEEFLSALSEARTSLKHLKNDQSPSSESLF